MTPGATGDPSVDDGLFAQRLDVEPCGGDYSVAGSYALHWPIAIHPYPIYLNAY